MIAHNRILIVGKSYVGTTTWTAGNADSTVVIIEPYVIYSKPQEEIDHEKMVKQIEEDVARYNAEHCDCPFVVDESVADVPSVRCKARSTRSQRRPRRINLSTLARPPPVCRWLATGPQAVAFGPVAQFG